MGMHSCYRMRLARIAVLTLMGLLLIVISGVLPSTVMANLQDSSTTATTPTAGTSTDETEETAKADDDRQPADEFSEMDLWAVLLLAVTLTVLILAYAVLTHLNNRTSQKTLLELGRKGIAVEAIAYGLFERLSSNVAGLNLRKREDFSLHLVKIAISGPGKLETSDTAVYTASVSGVDSPQLTWKSSDNAGLAVVQEGTNAKVTAAKVGKYTLTAEVVIAGMDPSPGEIPVEVVAKQVEKSGVKVPFFGAGFGSLILAAGLMVFLLLLSLAGLVDGDNLLLVLTGALGGLLGGTAVAANTNKGGDGSSTTS